MKAAPVFLYKTTCSKTTISRKEHNSVGSFKSLVDGEDWSRRLLAKEPSVYPDDPFRFYPERFLNDDLDKPLEGHWSFGLGRRGESVSRCWLTCTSVRWISSCSEESLDCDGQDYVLL